MPRRCGVRKDILVVPSVVNIPAPDIWRLYVPGTFNLQGMNQDMMEHRMENLAGTISQASDLLPNT